MRRRLIHQTIFLDAQIDLGILLVSVIISLSAHLVTVADRKINDAAGSDASSDNTDNADSDSSKPDAHDSSNGSDSSDASDSENSSNDSDDSDNDRA